MKWQTEEQEVMPGKQRLCEGFRAVGTSSSKHVRSDMKYSEPRYFKFLVRAKVSARK